MVVKHTSLSISEQEHCMDVVCECLLSDTTLNMRDFKSV